MCSRMVLIIEPVFSMLKNDINYNIALRHLKASYVVQDSEYKMIFLCICIINKTTRIRYSNFMRRMRNPPWNYKKKKDQEMED